MKRLSLLLAVLLAPGALWASEQCAPTQNAVIDSEVRCVSQGGISIGIGDEEGAKVACMASKKVQGRCGPDGQLTRLHAYTVWLDKLKKFQETCSAKGGTFSFQDPNFVEPNSESFCLQAVPEIGSSMFEEPLCNYRSTCPAVAVMCERPCGEHSVAQLY